MQKTKMLYILSRGNVDGICASAIYIRAMKMFNESKFDHKFCEAFELEELVGKIDFEQIEALSFIDLDISSILSFLINLKIPVKIYTDKAIIKEKLSPLLVISNESVSTARVIFNYVEEEINRRGIVRPQIVRFNEYLATIADLAERILYFSDFPHFQQEVVNFTSSLTLKPFDNQFREFILSQFVKDLFIKDIDEIRNRAIQVKYLTERILEQSPQHKVWEASIFIIYEYNETDIIIFNKEEYELRGRFSYLAQRLAIIGGKICLLLIHKDMRTYIVLRKHKVISENLLKVAQYISKSLEGTYGGHPNAVSINFSSKLDKEKLIEILKNYCK